MDQVSTCRTDVDWAVPNCHAPIVPPSESASRVTYSSDYQATWVRQGTTELVFVCPLPSDASALGLGRSSNHPPAREHCVAVDRLFMLPLRKAVEAAPRISRAGAPPRRSSHAIPS